MSLVRAGVAAAVIGGALLAATYFSQVPTSSRPARPTAAPKILIAGVDHGRATVTVRVVAQNAGTEDRTVKVHCTAFDDDNPGRKLDEKYLSLSVQADTEVMREVTLLLNGARRARASCY